MTNQPKRYLMLEELLSLGGEMLLDRPNSYILTEDDKVHLYYLASKDELELTGTYSLKVFNRFRCVPLEREPISSDLQSSLPHSELLR